MRVLSKVGGVDRAALDKHVDAVNDLATGGTNASGDVTLAPGATTTEVSNPLCTANTMVTLSPRSATAAAAQVWVQSTAKGTFTLGHDSSAAADRAFHYELRRR